MTLITFTDRDNRDWDDLYPDYTTLIHLEKNFVIKLIHCTQGIGLSDKYLKKTYIEVYRDNMWYTDVILREIEDFDPNQIYDRVIATSSLLKTIMDIINAKL